eukprot:GHVL01022359.1.p1 GENE.GHVL01022359.1~~GHVL01022359.1.p1  ORF type:complete len:270 (+),score=62.16 GHVL01022359.1:420-1229(+)
MEAPVLNIFAPYRWLLSPKMYGTDRIPTDSTKLLFVSNHSLLGLEMPLLIEGLYRTKGLFLRGLGDQFHFYFPGYKHLFERMGAVDGNRENCQLLMKNNFPILVYPGGAHEVFKKKTDLKYSLKWKNRLGFAKLAIENGYTLIPCGSIGTEDMLKIHHDIPVGWLIGRSDLSVPLCNIPSPQQTERVYFWFGNPIPTQNYFEKMEEMDSESFHKAAEDIRDQVRTAVEEGIEFLKKEQMNDPYRMLPIRTKKAMIDNFSRLFSKIKKKK